MADIPITCAICGADLRAAVLSNQRPTPCTCNEWENLTPKMHTLYRISAPHFVAGIAFDRNTAVLCPPIIRYMTGWHLANVSSYCHARGWIIHEVEE